MRKALVVGINYYSDIDSLFGCVNDAHNVKSVLERNSPLCQASCRCAKKINQHPVN